MSFRDIEAMLVAHTQDATGFRACTELFPGFEDELPVILVQSLPGAAKHHPFNGIPLTDSADFDIDVYASTPETVADASSEVREALLGWLPGGVTVTEKSRFARRPDHNPKIRRRGGVYGFTVQRRTT